uniref:Uncharacterized protein n=1 Tax=Rhizophagus irregularis (strain DAOM 181602 / DAOM 197198 / MUCL 43194) TaxID=747089 RepID=U9SKS2_RHIID
MKKRILHFSGARYCKKDKAGERGFKNLISESELKYLEEQKLGYCLGVMIIKLLFHSESGTSVKMFLQL